MALVGEHKRYILRFIIIYGIIIRTFDHNRWKEVPMSVVDVVAVTTGPSDELAIKPFSDRPATHAVSYAHLVLVPCEGSEAMPSLSGDQHLIRLARRGNCLVWRNPEDARSWSNPDDHPAWEVVAERTLVDPETGEQSVLSTSESVQVGDLIYVVEQSLYEHHAPRRRFLGRVGRIITCV